MKDKKIQKKENVQLRKKKQRLKEKGITLIALVVTIIILLILAGVTLNLAISGNGLFSRARNAADKYKKAQEDEVELISQIGKEMYSEYVGAYVTGYEPTGGECKITKEQSGTEEDQEFSTDKEKDLKWRIWDYDGTTLRIILDRQTTQTLKLKGTSGYNNGVWAINEICRQCFGQYENGEMKKGISVANLKRSDIEAVGVYDYTKYSKKINSTGEDQLIHYGEKWSSEEKLKAPIMWTTNDFKWSYEYDKEKSSGVGDPSCDDPFEQEFGYKNEVGELMSSWFRQSYYVQYFEGKDEEFRNQKYYDIICGEDLNKLGGIGTWLGGRCVDIFNGGVAFAVDSIASYCSGWVIGGFGLIHTDRNYK